MPHYPDYGLHLLEQNLGHVEQHFYSLPLDHLTLLEPGQGFTTQVNLEHGEHVYAASFDVPDELWEALLTALPEDVADELVAELQHARSVPYTVELTRVVRVQVVARPGTPRRGAHDTFVPLLVERVGSVVGPARDESSSTDGQQAPLDAELLAAAITVGGFYFEAGVRRYDQWTARVVADAGERIRPYLRSVYAALRHWPGLHTEGMDDGSDIDAP